MDVDAAQYAEISREMLASKNYLQVFCFGQPYLDKPPLLFWLNVISFKLFGIGNASYKLPSLLFALLAIYSTYRFAKLFYDEQTALKSCVILATTQALFLITNDVRTDTILMGAVTFCIWQLAEYLETTRTLHLILGSIGLGFALLAKGPVGLMVPVLALLPHIALKKTWRSVLNFRLVIAAFIVLLMLLPMCIGLYQEWGWHGINFYFWIQSFGRVLGKTQWNNHPDPLFLLHTTIWAFAPWSLFLFAGIVYKWGWLIKNRSYMGADDEIISISGFTLTAIILMVSKYQLPHYIFVIYPLGAVLAASCLKQMHQWGFWKFVLIGVQLIILVLITLLAYYLQFCFKGTELLSLFTLVIIFPLALVIAIMLTGPLINNRARFIYISENFKKLYNSATGSKKWYWGPHSAVLFHFAERNLFGVSVAVIIAFNFLMSGFFYPEILKYQPQSDFGRYIQQHASPGNNFITYQLSPPFSLLFYAKCYPAYETFSAGAFQSALNAKKNCLVFTSQQGINSLNQEHVSYQIIEGHEAYPVTNLSLPFLNPHTRQSVCTQLYLVEARI